MELEHETIEIIHSIKSREAFSTGFLKKIDEVKNCQEISNTTTDIIGKKYE